MSFKFLLHLILPVLALIFWSYILQPTPNEFPLNNKSQVQLIDSDIMIWYGDHALKHTGWAERPVLQFETFQVNEDLVDFSKLKKWDSYIIMNKQLFIEIKLMDYHYSQIVSLKVVDLELGSIIYKEEEIDFTSQMIKTLNDESIHYRGNIFVKGKNIQMEIKNTLKSNYRPTYKNITIRTPKFDAYLQMMRPVALRDIVNYQPINSQRDSFIFSTKGYNIPVKGSFSIREKKYNLFENVTTSGYNIGRGIFGLQTAWVWVHGNGFQNNKRYGINLGGGIQLPEAANSTEDAFFIDDEITKLKSAEIYQYFDDVNKQWVFKTKEFKEMGDFEIYFYPNKELSFTQDFQYNFFYFTQTKQFLGKIEGRVKDKNKDVRTFKNIQAYGEIFKARW